MTYKSLSELKADLRRAIESGLVNDSILSYLIPDGSPHATETNLWDYKLDASELPKNPSKEEKAAHKLFYAEIVKDAVSFHNAFGGYILFGVKDSGSDRVVGCENIIDIDELNQKIQAAVGNPIECIFEQLTFGGKNLGLLYVPRRPNDVSPACFKKDGPKKQNGKKTYSQGVYVRILDECRPAAATHEDWSFLYSDRSLNSSRLKAEVNKVPAKLPAKDGDLIEFVGRSQELVSLRDWLSYPRSPVRLLTGIGGLGKTTIAYAFVEEVVRSGFSELDRVIWVTAKKTTFSALKGEIVQTSGSDFADLTELLEQLIVHLAGHSSVPEDADLEELADTLVEVLKIYPSLIVVDDLDSLSPETQRECAAQLSQIASRTVDREYPPSRILMTARLDQGLSPTSVLKISGLDEKAFSKHIHNLSTQFELPKVNSREVRKMHRTTQGSPLFAGSLMRLVSLGENIKVVCDTWAGCDGEDVRMFAFKRELERLNQKAAETLYAVLLLGETTLEDLERVLEISRNSLRDKVSELQNFHLIAKGESKFGDTLLVPSKELISVTSILKKHILDGGKSVERACARLRTENKGNERNIGINIRKIVDFWKENNFEAALVVAKELRDKYPHNGDVACALGVTFLKSHPPRYKDAELALEAARAASCTRPELQSSLLLAMQGTENWPGLLEYSKSLSSRNPRNDEVLSAFLLATSRLMAIAELRGDKRREAELAIRAIERIESKISSQSLSPEYFLNLRSRQESLASKYISILRSLYIRPGDQLDVFSGIIDLVNYRVVRIEHIRLACKCLTIWWSDVEGREIFDVAAYDILQEKLKILQNMKTLMSSNILNYDNIVGMLDSTVRELSFRAGAHQSQNA